MTTFDAWLATAPEEEKRIASDYRHHYPVEQLVWSAEEARLFGSSAATTFTVVCGCDEHMAYRYGEGEHR